MEGWVNLDIASFSEVLIDKDQVHLYYPNFLTFAVWLTAFKLNTRLNLGSVWFGA